MAARSRPVRLAAPISLNGWCAAALRWTGRNFQRGDTRLLNATPNMLAAASGKAVMLNPGSIGPVFARAEIPQTARTTQTRIPRNANVQSLFDHDEPGCDHCAVPCHEPLCRQPAADAWRISRLPGSSYPQHRHRSGNDHDALGHAPATPGRQFSGHKHPQYHLTPLARLAQAREPLPGASEQLRRIRARTKPGNKKEGCNLVCAERG